MQATEETPTSTSEFATMTKVQKLATLLIILGPDAAAQMLKTLNGGELEAVASEMAKITLITQDLQKDILREFTGVAVEASSSILGGVGYTQSSLEKSVGTSRAATIISRVAPLRAPVAAIDQIVDMEPRLIFNLIKNERPQTIALVVSYLPADKSSQLLLLLPPERRELVVDRLATMAPTPIDVVGKVVQSLLARAVGKDSLVSNQTGGLKSTADLLNAMERKASNDLLAAIEQRNPELGRAIRQKMFTFEDLTRLDPAALQKLLREVDMRDLAVALKNASEKVKAALLSCISKRAAETVNEEISFLGQVKPREIEAAQNRIIEIVRRLESEGEIEIDSSGSSNERAA